MKYFHCIFDLSVHPPFPVQKVVPLPELKLQFLPPTCSKPSISNPVLFVMIFSFHSPPPPDHSQPHHHFFSCGAGQVLYGLGQQGELKCCHLQRCCSEEIDAYVLDIESVGAAALQSIWMWSCSGPTLKVLYIFSGIFCCQFHKLYCPGQSLLHEISLPTLPKLCKKANGKLTSSSPLLLRLFLLSCAEMAGGLELPLISEKSLICCSLAAWVLYDKSGQ